MKRIPPRFWYVDPGHYGCSGCVLSQTVNCRKTFMDGSANQHMLPCNRFAPPGYRDAQIRAMTASALIGKFPLVCVDRRSND